MMPQKIAATGTKRKTQRQDLRIHPAVRQPPKSQVRSTPPHRRKLRRRRANIRSQRRSAPRTPVSPTATRHLHQHVRKPVRGSQASIRQEMFRVVPQSIVWRELPRLSLKYLRETDMALEKWKNVLHHLSDLRALRAVRQMGQSLRIHEREVPLANQQHPGRGQTDFRLTHRR
jgi:hypothetical protein